MTTATVTSKGQITIPANMRKALSAGSGDRVEFVALEPGKFLFVAAKRPVIGLKGMFGKSARIVSVDEMSAVIASKGAAAR